MCQRFFLANYVNLCYNATCTTTLYERMVLWHDLLLLFLSFWTKKAISILGPLVCQFGTFMVYTTIADSYDEVCSKLNFLKISERTSFFNFANLPKPEGKVYLFGSINQNEDGEPFFYNRYIGIAIPVFGLTKDCVIVEF